MPLSNFIFDSFFIIRLKIKTTRPHLIYKKGPEKPTIFFNGLNYFSYLTSGQIEQFWSLERWNIMLSNGVSRDLCSY